MKILLINNHTNHLEDLCHSLSGHSVEVQEYKPGLDFHYQGKDLVVLSGGGGEGLEIYDEHEPGKRWYQDEMDFVLEVSRNKPVIGICMGFEVIACSFGSKIDNLPDLVSGYKTVRANSVGRKHFSSAALNQFESHRWCVKDISTKEFEILAETDTGIEAIKHKNRPIFATQFHPEKGGAINLQQIINKQLIPA